MFVLGHKENGRLGLGPDCDDVKVLTQVRELSDKRCIDVSTGFAQSFAVTDSGKENYNHEKNEKCLLFD